jgi:hypothetical protein
LEKGDARPNKEEEEVAQEKVSIHILHGMTAIRTRLSRSLKALTSPRDALRIVYEINGVQAKLSEHGVISCCTISANHHLKNTERRLTPLSNLKKRTMKSARI